MKLSDLKIGDKFILVDSYPSDAPTQYMKVGGSNLSADNVVYMNTKMRGTLDWFMGASIVELIDSNE